MEPGSGRIITFYSYKGGTGRSMALANVAWVLAANRKRVLLIDWDLEAPGLHRYFRPFLIDKYLTSSEGLIDFVLAYADEVIKPAAESLPADWFLPLADITAYAVSVDFDGFPAPGRIDLVPAGCQGASYATRVNSFNWQNFYDRLGGGAFFEAVRAQVRQEYDYILIDSRTGVSDTSGICTIQMPDALAVCFTYNNQSIEGAAAIAKSARESRSKLPGVDGRGGFDIFPIPTRVEQGERQKLSARQKYAFSHFKDLLASDLDSDPYWKAVEIPYVPFYGYEEVLAPFSPEDPNDPKSLFGAIVRITRFVTAKDRAPDEKVDFNLSLSEEEKRRIRQEFAATPDSQKEEETASSVTSAEEAVREKVRQADIVFLRLDLETQLEARRVLLRLVRIARPEDGSEHSRQRVKLSEFDEAAKTVVSDLASAVVLVIARDTVSGEEVVEIIDDTLVRNWTRLRGWIDKDRDFLLWRQKLRDLVVDWAANGFKNDFLLRGERLREAQSWLSEHSADLNKSETEFINRSSQTDFAGVGQSEGAGRRAFIIRPFGKKKDSNGNEIDFDQIHNTLIAPALKALGAEGATAIDVVEAGNIRTDMFSRLLTADIIIADVSVSNPNVFYELGVRHALRERSTLLLCCRTDRVAFDLQVDRYFWYSNESPSASLSALIEALRLKLNSHAADSPVFMSLPELSEPDSSQFTVVPSDFREEIEQALTANQPGDLMLISYEVGGFEWEMKGWRTVGSAQLDLKALVGARETWEKIRKLEPQDLEANIRLGTVYERLDDLTRSTQALQRALDNKGIKRDERAETLSLLARNAKVRWRSEWEAVPPEERPATALRSPYLNDSFENYERAFGEDINHFYSGLNALAMLSIMVELAESLPDVWGELFDTDKAAADALESHKEHAAKLNAAVDVSLNATLSRLNRESKKDVWAEISSADLLFITSKRPPRVASAYRAALAGAPGFARDSVQKQLSIYKELGVLGGNLAEVIKVVGELPPMPSPGIQQARNPPRKRVLLFAGHMIDNPDRKNPRFRPDKELVAREKIKEAIVKEMETGAGVASGYAGGASGGDILFLEVCAELGIPTRLYLAVTAKEYVTKSVANAGPQWIKRFWDIYNSHSARSQARVLSEATDVTDESEYLPAWLRSRPDYSIWQRNNLWMLFNALNERCDPKTGDPNITLIALWDGAGGDGPGGTGDLVTKVEAFGARSEIINTKELFGL